MPHWLNCFGLNFKWEHFFNNSVCSSCVFILVEPRNYCFLNSKQKLLTLCKENTFIVCHVKIYQFETGILIQLKKLSGLHQTNDTDCATLIVLAGETRLRLVTLADKRVQHALLQWAVIRTNVHFDRWLLTAANLASRVFCLLNFDTDRRPRSSHSCHICFPHVSSQTAH